MHKLLTKPIIRKLKLNWDKDYEHCRPVAKLFGGGACTWLVMAMDEDDDTLLALCDLGMGSPELGYVSLKDLQSLKFPPFGLPVERDIHWEASQSMKKYCDEARQSKRITA